MTNPAPQKHGNISSRAHRIAFLRISGLNALKLQVANQEIEAVDVGLVQFSSTCVGKNFNIVSFRNGDPPMAPDFSKLNDKPDFRKSI